MDSIKEIAARDVAYIRRLRAEGAATAQASSSKPRAAVGLFAGGLEPWEPGKTYDKRYTLFLHEGKVGFTRQAGVLAQAHQPPFSTGMEAVYGVRPIPNAAGIYPYVYNMAAEVGMRVQDGDTIYACIESIDPLLWPPSQVPRYFMAEQ